MTETASDTAVKAPITNVPRWLMYAVSFWGGLQIMVLEVCGFRVLQTNLGSSVIVTGTLLTLIMILLAGGYYLGGRLSARLRSARGLFALLLIAAVYTEIVTTLFLDGIGSLGLSLHTWLGNYVFLRAGLPASVLTLLLYGPPVFLMSMISPYWIRLRTASATGEDSDAGFQAGFFMSLSTVGSIAGTVLASYLLIPFFGVTVTASSTNAVFLVLVLGGWLWTAAPAPKMSVARALIVLLVLGGAMFGLRLSKPERDPSIVYEGESHYGQMRVVKSVSDTGHPMLTYHPSRLLTNTMVYLDDPLREMEALMFLMPGLVSPPENILVLGSAAGGIMRKIELVFPDAKVTAVDLDPKVHDLARDYFGVSPAHELVTADARMHLMADKRKYDLIMVDVFSGEFVPTHCITREFFEMVRQHLSPKGTVYINTLMDDVHHDVPEDDEPFRAMRHLESTLMAAGFPTLFESSFFHSLFVFQHDMSIEQLREKLLAIYTNPSVVPSVRAGTGLAAFTTVRVPAERARYRAFSDVWSPGLLIELKGNEKAIYRAVRETRSSVAPAGRGSDAAVEALVIEHRLNEADATGWPELQSAGPLVNALNSLQGEVSMADVDVAAKYFRFEWDVTPSDVPALTPWAKVAALYADAYRISNQHEYEALLPVLEQLRVLLEPGQG